MEQSAGNENVKEDVIIGLLQERSELAVLLLRDKYEEVCRKIAAEASLSGEDFEECFNGVMRSLWNSDPHTYLQPLSFSVEKAMRNAVVYKLGTNLRKLQRGGAEDLLFGGGIDLSGRCDFVKEDLLPLTITERIASYLVTQPERTQMFFVARYWALLPVREIAERFSVPEYEVMESLRHAREALKAYLDDGEAAYE